MSGSNAHANLGAYAPSKAAVIMLMRVLAQEFGRDGIRVNSVSRHGAHRHDREALPELGAGRRARGAGAARRVATPEDIADVVAFLLAPTPATSTATTSSWTRGERKLPRPAAGISQIRAADQASNR